jgi:hypothetical protein
MIAARWQLRCMLQSCNLAANDCSAACLELQRCNRGHPVAHCFFFVVCSSKRHAWAEWSPSFAVSGRCGCSKRFPAPRKICALHRLRLQTACVQPNTACMQLNTARMRLCAGAMCSWRAVTAGGYVVGHACVSAHVLLTENAEGHFRPDRLSLRPCDGRCCLANSNNLHGNANAGRS